MVCSLGNSQKKQRERERDERERRWGEGFVGGKKGDGGDRDRAGKKKSAHNENFPLLKIESKLTDRMG